MASPTSPKRVLRLYRQLIYGVESVAAGTAATTFTQEPCRAVVPTVNRAAEQQMEYTGTAAALVDDLEMTHSSATVITVPARVAGYSSLATAAIIGNACDTVTGTTPKIHTCVPPATTTACNTLTHVIDTGDRSGANVAQNLLQYTFCTVASVSYAMQPNGVNIVTVNTVGNHPTIVALPTITNYVGSTANYPKTRVAGFQNTFTLIASDGSTQYTSNITSGTLTLTRAVSPEFGIFQQNAFDYVPGELMIAGSFTATYDGP